MTRPGICPIGGEPCQSLCETPCNSEPTRDAMANHAETSGSPIHDPKHPYVMRMIGCGHGVLFKNYCRHCEIVGVMEQYKNAVKTIAKCRNELRRLGAPLPGQVAP